MKLSDKGLYALALHEGIVPGPYLDTSNVWTFGIGHAETSGLAPNPRHMPRGMPADVDKAVAQAFDLFRRRVTSYEDAVARAVKVDLAQHEFDALVSFHFNTGAIAKASGTAALNGGDPADAWRRYALYNKSGGKVNRGLVRRRGEEADLFLRAKYPSGPIPIYAVDGNGKLGRIIRTMPEAEAMRLLGQKAPTQPREVYPAPTPRPAPVAPSAPATARPTWVAAFVAFFRTLVKSKRSPKP